ncbi:1270_t:CDS:2 [Diversispora eburnea]|uniref:1270_t:CDS:1 n=1 Tax=Diversispora eburnea TaxID=1213867 RepID=A0A9N9ALU5_9GLOM|nr:1270_t:CDS:2 [Diversispora eburnea]
MNNFKHLSSNGEGTSTNLGKRKAAEVEDGSSTGGKMKETRKEKFKQKTKERIKRAITEHMYLVGHKEINLTQREYTILGPTGCVYTTVIANILSCSCPDFQKGFQCKHLVLKVNQDSKLIYQKALLTDELRSIFDKAPRIYLQPSKKFINQLEETITSIKRHRKIGDDCPICYDPMNDREDLVWCQSGCGNNIHRNCFNQWRQINPTVK